MALDEFFPNMEFRHRGGMAGQHYIAATLREDGTRAKLIWISPERCGHINRICINCCYMWAWDYQLYFERTVRGRFMAEQLIALGRDPVAVAHGRVHEWPSDTDVTRGPVGDDGRR